MDHLLPILLAVPIVGALLCAFAPRSTVRQIALAASLLEVLVALAMFFQFDFSSSRPQLLANLGSIPSIGFNFTLGVDSISLWLVALTVFLQPLAIAASFQSIQDRAREYYAWMLALLAAMLGVFVARDLLLFYVFFELTLVPMFFIIGIWGGPQRRYAAGKFFLFTFAGSVFTLAAIIYLNARYGTFDIAQVMTFARFGSPDGRAMLGSSQMLWVTLGFLAGFAVKVPLFPVHTWLPLAHTEAPTAGSVILAGVLLKLGTYGILRLALPMGFIHAQPREAAAIVPFPTLLQVVGVLCLIGIIYGALVAWVQQDIKKLVAYSSVSHLGFCVLGLAALNQEGVQGSVLYMINHGLSTGAMFLVIGMIYDRFHTRDINELSGLARKMPIMSFFFILFTLSSIGLPGLNGFVSEFLTILGAFRSPHLGIAFGSIAALGIILGAVYMLHMVARVIFGPVKTPEVHEPHDTKSLPADLNGREIGIMIPIALAVVILGVIPSKVLTTLEKPVQELIGKVEKPTAEVAEDRRGEIGPLRASASSAVHSDSK